MLFSLFFSLSSLALMANGSELALFVWLCDCDFLLGGELDLFGGELLVFGAVVGLLEKLSLICAGFTLAALEDGLLTSGIVATFGTACCCCAGCTDCCW